MAKEKSFDEVLRKMCNKKLGGQDSGLLGEKYTAQEAIAAAVVQKAMGGSADAVKLIREILAADSDDKAAGAFSIDIRVVD